MLTKKTNYVPEYHHRKHRNVLYSLVVVLAILQIVSFTILSIQISQLNVKFDSEMKETNKELKQFATDFTTDLVETYNSLYQENFQEISRILAQQQENFEQEINLLKTAREDFSGVVKNSVKSVVTVSTGSSIGSGFIVNPEGYVVTNYHVINGQEDGVSVLTYDRKILEAEIIGTDEIRDLAVLKIAGEYDALPLADSDTLQVGSRVIAIGNPLGLSFTVTEGIISALHRQGPSGLPEYVQTDVSLNPGNSGGPLINLQGKVVGINNFKIGGAESLGFALESNIIRKSANLVANRTIIE